MTQKNSTPQEHVSCDEVSLRELMYILWHGRVTIVLSTIVCILGSLFYSYIQPNIYQSTSSFLLEYNFYNTTGISEPYFSPEFFKSRTLKDDLLAFSKVKHSGIDDLEISYKESKSKRDGVESATIILSALSTDPLRAFDSVVNVSNVLNKVMKQRELNKVNLSIEKLGSKSDSSYSRRTKEYLDEILAQQLYKKAILESPESNLIQVASLPVKPNYHIKPTRILTTIFGVFLGIMSGVVIVLTRAAFKPK